MICLAAGGVLVVLALLALWRLRRQRDEALRNLAHLAEDMFKL